MRCRASVKPADLFLHRTCGKLSQLTADTLYQPACFVDESTTALGLLAEGHIVSQCWRTPFRWSKIVRLDRKSEAPGIFRQFSYVVVLLLLLIHDRTSLVVLFLLYQMQNFHLILQDFL